MAVNGLILAMAHHRLNHAAEARKAFDKAVHLMDRPAKSPDGKALDMPWNDRLVLQLLRREAESLIKPTKN